MGCGASRNEPKVGARPNKGGKSGDGSSGLTIDLESMSRDDQTSMLTTTEAPGEVIHLSVIKTTLASVSVEWVAAEPREPGTLLCIFYEIEEVMEASTALGSKELPLLGSTGMSKVSNLKLEADQSYRVAFITPQGAVLSRKQFWVDINPEEDDHYHIELVRKKPSSVTVDFGAPGDTSQDWIGVFDRVAADADYLAFSYCVGTRGSVTIQRLNLEPGTTYHVRFISMSTGTMVAKAALSFEVDVPRPESKYSLTAASVSPSSVLVLYMVPDDHDQSDEIAVFPCDQLDADSVDELSDFSRQHRLGAARVTSAACGTVEIGGLALESDKSYSLVYFSGKDQSYPPMSAVVFAGPRKPP